MEPMRIRRNNTPEAEVEAQIVAYLEARNWLVRKIHGGARNFGWPDLRISHKTKGSKWVEVKLPGMKGSKFSKAQLEWFPKMMKYGDHIWIMTGPNHHQYKQLFTRPQGNLWDYWIPN